MLPRRSASEVAVHDEDARAGIARIVEGMSRIRRPVVLEQMPLQPFECDGAQEPRRHDAVGIEVVTAERKRAAGDGLNGGHEVSYDVIGLRAPGFRKDMAFAE